MSEQVALVFILTFIIHLISTLTYAVRIAGIRTRRIAVSFALFNVLALLSRTSNTFQAPLLSKHVEQNILRGTMAHAESDFRWLLLAATLATLTGGLLIPTFQRIFTSAIEVFSIHRSVPRLLFQGFSVTGIRQVKSALSIPAKQHLKPISISPATARINLYNIVATALLTVGVFASLYAGYLNPQLRVTANNMSPIINGLSTVLLFAFIDPYLSIMTDDVLEGRMSDPAFRRQVTFFAISRLVGTLLAQVIFVPAARLVALVANYV
jgi:hypothetical protein